VITLRIMLRHIRTPGLPKQLISNEMIETAVGMILRSGGPMLTGQ